MGVPYGKSFKESNFSFDLTIPELDAEVHVDSFDSGYDPYPTQNHDDPRFSDPGSGPESEYHVILVKRDSKGKVIKSVDITDFLSKDDYTAIEEQISEEACEKRQSAYEAAMEDKAEAERERER